jgi:ComF family protein
VSGERDFFLCENCEGELIAIEKAGACDRCARPLVQWGDPCPYCKGKGIHPFDRIVALGIFTDPLKELIHHMKYHRRWGLAEAMADRLLATARVREVMERAEVVVPVPLHWWRQIGRGYNQSDVIARRLARKKKVVHAVRRLRNTPPQTRIRSHEERHENVKDAFAMINEKAVAGRHVVVVDDVITTMSTIRAVARAMAGAKPLSISAVALAVADPKGRGFEVI